ncbi:hypothetical protein [Streptomyces albiaxialis]
MNRWLTDDSWAEIAMGAVLYSGLPVVVAGIWVMWLRRRARREGE